MIEWHNKMMWIDSLWTLLCIEVIILTKPYMSNVNFFLLLWFFLNTNDNYTNQLFKQQFHSTQFAIRFDRMCVELRSAHESQLEIIRFHFNTGIQWN